MDIFRDLDDPDGTLLFRLDALAAAARYSGFYVDDWPMVAAEALAASGDSPALVALASEYADTPRWVIRDRVDAATAELGIHAPDPEAAAWCLGLIAALALARRVITPPELLAIIADLTHYGERAEDLYHAFAPIWEWDVVQLRPAIAEEAHRSAVRLLHGAGDLVEQVIIRETSSRAPLSIECEHAPDDQQPDHEQ